MEVAVLDLIVPNSPYDFRCGRKATLEEHCRQSLWMELRESGSGCPGPNSPYDFCGRKATLNERTNEERSPSRKFAI